ncbi:nuclear factor erythroid 2-related factor 3 [Dromiciops gliroides]|uniref:nuclear factor erythroid 2-related factor 3 n=1 Tax=Dromiciops gliroides TaxID=33562 RepID=UPI001CC353BD|nr:nuclear factor erythroid 2-related factor 3 [Dromiciops gliroides]
MMMYLKPSWAHGCGGLLHLAVLLSLAGLRMDLDLYLLLPSPPPLLRDPWAFMGNPGGAAYALPPLRGGAVGGSDQLHPKCWDADSALQPEGQHLLQEVRTLGGPFIPRTHVDAWLVHRVAAAGGADGAPRLLGNGAPTEASGGGGPGDPGGSSSGGGSGPARGEDKDKEAEEEKSPTAAPASGGVETSGWAVQESSGDETDVGWPLEDIFHLMAPPMESPPEGILARPPMLLCNNSCDGVDDPGQYSVNFSQAISHDVSLHEAMLWCPETSRRDPRARQPQTLETFLPLNSGGALPLPGMDWAGLFPSAESRTRNLTAQDLLLDLDENIFDEINLISFAMEEGFDPMAVSQLFEEPDSDSGLSLNSSHTSTSAANPNSSASLCDDEGAVGYSSDAESLSHRGLEGAVGGHWPETSELCGSDGEKGLEPSGEPILEHIFHNHTYYLLPSAPSSEPLLPWSHQSQNVKRSGYHRDHDSILSQDDHHAKTLCLPFSVDEIVSMPVDSFNSVLAKSYLTDTQVSLLRDIRRRGKNKVAAQNCRKRKLDVILSLEEDVCSLRAKKESLKRERAQCSKSLHLMKQKLRDLYRDVFSRLRDDQGRPVNPNLYALHCGRDGSVLIVPKELMTSSLKKDNQKEKERK